MYMAVEQGPGDADIKTKRETTTKKNNLEVGLRFFFSSFFLQMLSMVLPDVWTSTFISFQDVGGDAARLVGRSRPVCCTDWNDVRWCRRKQRQSALPTAELWGRWLFSFLLVLLFFFLFSGAGDEGEKSVWVYFVARPGSLLFWLLFLSWSISCRMYRKRFGKNETQVVRVFLIFIFFFPFCFKNEIWKKRKNRERTRLPVRPLAYVDVSLHSNKKTKLKASSA